MYRIGIAPLGITIESLVSRQCHGDMISLSTSTDSYLSRRIRCAIREVASLPVYGMFQRSCPAACDSAGTTF